MISFKQYLGELVSIQNSKIEEPGNDIVKDESGAFSVVHDDTDPHLIVKHSRDFVSPDSDDGYFNYIQAIHEYVPQNPFFPRVYILDKNVDTKGFYSPKYKMEKLKNITEFNIPVIISLMSQVMDDDGLNFALGVCLKIASIKYNKTDQTEITSDNIDYILSGISEDDEQKLFSRMWEYLCDYISDLVGGYQKCPNKYLNQAVKVIQGLVSKGYTVDIHEHNIMIRTTSVGPQLVITDPIENLDNWQER